MRVLTGVLVGLLAGAAAPGGEPATDTASLDAVLASLRAVRHVEARYVERRTLHALTAPIQTSGTLRFDAPDRVEKSSDLAADAGVERLLIDRGQIRIERTGAAPLAFSVADHPEIGVLVESIRATLAGDGDALQRAFVVRMAGTVSRWQLVLQPRAHRDLLQWMRIDGGGGRVSQIDTEDGDGDLSTMTIAGPMR